MASTAGFWSYVRDDDADGDGQIRRLAERVRAEYAMLTGERLELFLDREALEWGDQWEERIVDALRGATFFIPIVTPRYFLSASCREELLRFRAEAARSGLEDLLLPVYWVPVREIDRGNPTDEAMALIAGREWEDLRETRLLDERSAEYRQAVNRLAARLVDIAEEITEASTERVLDAGHDSDSLGILEDEDGPGQLELLAAGENAMPRLGEILESVGVEIQEVGELAVAATQQLHAADARGQGYAGRLRVADRLAAELQGPAETIERLGQEYATELVRADPAILTIIDEAVRTRAETEPATTEDLDEAEAAEAFLRMIAELTDSGSSAMTELREMIASMDDVGRLSRALRKPIRQMRAGLRGISDGQAIMDEWKRRATRLRPTDGGE